MTVRDGTVSLPVMWRYRGPRGGWIAVDEKPEGWPSEPLYLKPEVTPAMVEAEKLDAATLERRLHLWFFRDLSDNQRLGLFKLCGYPVDEMPTHAAQQMCLRHLIAALEQS